MDDGTVLGRALLVLDACLCTSQVASLAELTSATGLPKPTVYRLAEQLVRRRLLDRVEGG